MDMLPKHKAPGKSDRVGISLVELFRMFPDDATAEACLDQEFAVLYNLRDEDTIDAMASVATDMGGKLLRYRELIADMDLTQEREHEPVLFAWGP